MQTNSKYIIVDTPLNLNLLVSYLKKCQIISIDTESSGYFTYYPKVCLIQISAQSKNYILDPLKLENLQSLNTILNDPCILKIFHSAIDDIKVLKKDFQFQFQNIADTMLSSRYLGMNQNSLQGLVKHYHGIHITKDYQKSNWELRPLSEKQLEYAVIDTIYLESIWNKMKIELEEKNLLEEVESEFKFIAKDTKIVKDNEGLNLARFPNIENFSSEERGKILKILEFREEKARKMNKAPFRILNYESIVKVLNGSFPEESLIQALGKKEAKELLDILNSGNIPPIEGDEFKKREEDLLDEEKKEKLRNLKKWKDYIMKYRVIEHALLPSNKIFIEIIKSEPKNLEELQQLELISEWKVKNYGPSLLAALHGEPFQDKIPPLPPIHSKKGMGKFYKQVNTSENPS